MSIKAMTWAFGLPLEGRAKIILLAIADNARDDGVAWPSRDMIADKSSQSRATVNRRMKSMSDLGVMTLHERFRADGSQTTDEIRLDLTLTPEEVMRRMQASEALDRGKTAEDADAGEGPGDGLDGEEGGYQPDTPPLQSGHPGDAVVTPGGLQSGHPLNEPSLEPKIPPNPPLGGVHVGDGPLKKADKAAIEKREVLWQRFLGSYPGISAMDQRATREEFERMPVDDAEWAVSVCPFYDAECRKLRKPPKNAHIWLRKAMFKNFPKGKIEAPPPDEVWIAEGSDQDRALRLVRGLTRKPLPFVLTRADGARGYRHKAEVGADLLAMLLFADQSPMGWQKVDRGTAHFAAWQSRFADWTGAALPVDPTTQQIRVPTLWPPKKDGTIYHDEETPASQETTHG